MNACPVQFHDFNPVFMSVYACSSFFLNNKTFVVKMATKSRIYTNGIKCK